MPSTPGDNATAAVDTAKVAPGTATETTASPATTKVVVEEKSIVYVGTSDVRSITAADFKSVDVEDQNKVEWSAKNGFAVPVSELSESAVEFLTKTDGFAVKGS